jgi:parallel beta-helix repeat protein
VVVVVVAIAASAYFLYSADPGFVTIPTNSGPTPPIPGTYIDHEPFAILSDYELAQQALENEWSGNGTYNDPYIIEWLKIVSDGHHCIKIKDVREYHFVVRNCHLIANNESWGVCIKIYYCTNGVVENCIMETGYQGADFLESNDCSISDCYIRGVGCGINMTITERILVHDNWVEDCWWAIMLCGAIDSQLSDNYLTNNEVGINSQGAIHTTVYNNTIVDNMKGLTTSHSCTGWNITHCSFLNNTNVGIELTATTENFTLFNNRIGWNGVNARDDGLLNKWDDGIAQGNAWSDYSGMGVYAIPGAASSVDNFPSILHDEHL